jgi:hypothetical protein
MDNSQKYADISARNAKKTSPGIPGLATGLSVTVSFGFEYWL